MSDAQNTDRLGAERLELVCKVASIVLFVAAFMLAAVGAIHLAVLPGIIEPHLYAIAIEMALLALLLAAASTAVGVMGIMVVYHKFDAKRLFLASLGLAALTIVGVLLAKFVIRGIFGMGSLTRPGVLVVLCSAVIAFVCAQMLPKKLVVEDAEAESAEDTDSDGVEDSTEDTAGVDDADARESEAPAVEPEFESGDAPDNDAADDETADDEAANDDSPTDVEAADAADPSNDNAPVIDDDLEDDGPAQGLTLASRATIGNRSRSRRPRTHLCAMLNQG